MRLAGAGRYELRLAVEARHLIFDRIIVPQPLDKRLRKNSRLHVLIRPLTGYVKIILLQVTLKGALCRLLVKARLIPANYDTPAVVGAFQDELLRQGVKIDIVETVPYP